MLGALNQDEVEEDILRELKKIAKEGDPIMKEAIKKWEDLSRDPKAWYEYESHLKAVLDDMAAVREAEKRYQKAEGNGMEKGIEKVAKRMLEKGKERDEIMELTGLSKEQIERLQK